MTPGTHASPEDAPPKRRWSAWRLGTPVVVLACGALFVVSAVNSHGTDLRPGRYTDLASLAGSERDRYQHLENQVSDLQKQVSALTNAVPDGAVRKAQTRVDRLKAPAGLTPVTGSGISITLSDAPRDLIEKTTHNPNDLVVHQQDIQAVVNALWQGGAQAVTIQGQRIISTTGIKCSGSTVTLQGVPYPEPFVIRAVGDPTALYDAVENSPNPQLQYYIAGAADPTVDLGWNVQTEATVTAPAYKGLLDLTYAKPLKQ